MKTQNYNNENITDVSDFYAWSAGVLCGRDWALETARLNEVIRLERLYDAYSLVTLCHPIYNFGELIYFYAADDYGNTRGAEEFWLDFLECNDSLLSIMENICFAEGFLKGAISACNQQVRRNKNA